MIPDELLTLDRIIENEGKLSPWELDFIDSMDGIRDSPLSDKQSACLFNIGQRVEARS